MAAPCLPDGVSGPGPQVLVVSAAERWLSFRSLLQSASGAPSPVLLRPAGTRPGLGAEGGASLPPAAPRRARTRPDTGQEDLAQALGGCFGRRRGGSGVFLLLIEGGFYSKEERRTIDVLQAHFGAEALKFLVVLSLENVTTADTLDDSLMELINTCDGRYCRVSSVGAGDGLRPLLEMVDLTLMEHGGYSGAALAEARKRSAEDSAATMLRQKVPEAEEKGQAFQELVKLQEGRRARETEALRARHGEERRGETAERKQQASRERESPEEAVLSHRAMLQRQMSEGNLLSVNDHIRTIRISSEGSPERDWSKFRPRSFAHSRSVR